MRVLPLGLGIALLGCDLPAARGQSVFINEIHYDNAGTDVDEGVEIAGPAGTHLADYAIYLYNGNGGASYSSPVALTGTIPNERGTGFGAVWRVIPGIQNGDPDGIVLVRTAGSLVGHGISYGGSFSATNGPANGLLLRNIPVKESTSTPVGQSLQLTGNGTMAQDFVWTGPAPHSRAFLNAGQTFAAPQPSGILSLSSGILTEGGTATATLSLSPAPADPVTVILAATPSGVAGLPASVLVPVTGTVTFAISALTDGVPDGFQETALLATPTGTYPPAAAALQVIDADRPARSSPEVRRIMTLNVRLGIGSPGTAEFAAVREVIERVSPDILVLQEVSDAGDFGDARALLEQAGFPAGAAYRATTGDAFAGQAYSSGDFGTGECLITASRYPITATTQIGRGIAGRKELTRFPLYTRIDLPDTAHDLHVVNLHLKAGTADTDRFRKAVEAYRIREFLSQSNLAAAVDNLVVAGDFNAIDTIFLPPTSYNTSTYTPPAGTSLPVSFQLGSDLAASPGVTLAYSVAPYNPASSVYPHQGFNPAGLFAPALFQADGISASTFNLFDARFDYLMLPQRLLVPGNARGEVYNSRLEPQADGLPKRRTLPAAELSEIASDHHAVFLDVRLSAPPRPLLSLTISPGSVEETSAAPPPVATVSISPAPSGPVTVALGSWRDDRVRPAVASVILTPSRPVAQIPVVVPYSPLVEPQRAVNLTASAEGYAPASASLTVQSMEAAGLLVFSQYVEPAAPAAPPNDNTSRALELFNASGTTLDLRRLKWEVRRFTNGSNSPTSFGTVSAVFPDGSAALLPPGQVVVIGDAAVGNALVAAGFLTPPTPSFADAASGTLFCNAGGQPVFFKGVNLDFNGDDALEIIADGVRCDTFGLMGQDPGPAWTGGPGNPATADQNLTLRPEIVTGSTGFTLPGTRFTTTAPGNSLTGIGIPPVPTDRYLAWAAGQNLTGLARAPNSDPDGDGRLNLIEFLQETHPAAADSAPGTITTATGGSFLTMSPDPWLSVVWEQSIGLSPEWSPAPEVIGTPAGSAHTHWQWPVNPANGPRRFWRFRAGRP